MSNTHPSPTPLILADDGTLDTVFICPECGKYVRYAEVERDDAGHVTADAIAQATKEHAAECGLHE